MVIAVGFGIAASNNKDVGLATEATTVSSTTQAPDPLTKPPPSNSEFGVYERAAVAVDADECAEIGT